MMKLTPEQQFEVEASTMSREQLYNLAKRLWCEDAQLQHELDEARRKLSQLADMLDRQSG
jgi:hypothetical protein